MQQQSLIHFSLLRQNFCRAQREFCLICMKRLPVSAFSILPFHHRLILKLYFRRIQAASPWILEVKEVHCYSGKWLRNVRALRKLEIEEKKDLQKCRFSSSFFFFSPAQVFLVKNQDRNQSCKSFSCIGKMHRRFPRTISEQPNFGLYLNWVLSYGHLLNYSSCSGALLRVW